MTHQNYYQRAGYFCSTISIGYFLPEDLATFHEQNLSPKKLLEFLNKNTKTLEENQLKS